MRLLNPKDQDWLFEFSATAIKLGSSIRASASWADDGQKIVHLDALGRFSVFDTAIKDWHQVDLLPEWETTSIATSPDDLRVLCFGLHRSMPQNSERAFLFEKEGSAETLAPRLEAEALCLGPNSVFRFDLHGLETLASASLLPKSQHELGNAVWPLPIFGPDFRVVHSYNVNAPIVHSAAVGSIPLQEFVDVEIGQADWSEFHFSSNTQRATLHLKLGAIGSDDTVCSTLILDLLDTCKIEFNCLKRLDFDVSRVNLHYVPSIDLMLVSSPEAEDRFEGNTLFQTRMCSRFATFPNTSLQWLEINEAGIQHVLVDASGSLKVIDLVNLPCPSQDITSFEVSPDGHRFLLSNKIGNVWVFKL